MDKLFFDTWQSLGRTFLITVMAYFTMVIMLRISGKRTLSKMNAFDFIVTIALGSSLATVALNKKVTLADGALVFLLLIVLQFIITWLSIRIKKVKRVVTSQPALLLYKGEMLRDRMKKERITKEEIYVAARQKGMSELRNIDAIILETTGDLTVIPNLTSEPAQTMEDVKKPS